MRTGSRRQSRALHGGSPETWPDCGTHSVHYILHLFHVRVAVWLNSAHNYWKRKHPSDLPQGGLELPCTYTFTGPQDMIKKVKQALIDEGKSVDDAVEEQSVQKRVRWSFRIPVSQILLHNSRQAIWMLPPVSKLDPGSDGREASHQ